MKRVSLRADEFKYYYENMFVLLKYLHIFNMKARLISC